MMMNLNRRILIAQAITVEHVLKGDLLGLAIDAELLNLRPPFVVKMLCALEEQTQRALLKVKPAAHHPTVGLGSATPMLRAGHFSIGYGEVVGEPIAPMKGDLAREGLGGGFIRLIQRRRSVILPETKGDRKRREGENDGEKG